MTEKVCEKYCTRCKHADIFVPSWDANREYQPTGWANCAFRKGRFGEFSLACEYFIDLDEKVFMYSDNCDEAREVNASCWESFIKNIDSDNLERWPMTMESRKLLIQLVWESAWDYALIAAQKIKKD